MTQVILTVFSRRLVFKFPVKMFRLHPMLVSFLLLNITVAESNPFGGGGARNDINAVEEMRPRP